MTKIFKYLLGTIFLTASFSAWADMTVPIYSAGEPGASKLVGNIVISETKYGLLFTPHLQGLIPGVHGFHIHQNPSCADHAMAAGGHWDPKKTDKHLGPYNDQGHLGDLPALYVNADGTATIPVLAPRLKSIAQIKGHSLMIHEGGDNYSDEPAKAGGGGGRMFCAVIG